MTEIAFSRSSTSFAWHVGQYGAYVYFSPLLPGTPSAASPMPDSGVPIGNCSCCSRSLPELSDEFNKCAIDESERFSGELSRPESEAAC